MQISVTLTGTKPMLQHNARLVDPLEPLARELAKVSGKTKKSDSDHLLMMDIEARASVYPTDDGLVGLPTANVYRSIQEGARRFKMGKHVERALVFDDVVEHVLIDGETVSVDDFLKDVANISRMPVRVQRNKVMRSRPILRGWQSTHFFELDHVQLNLEKLEQAIEMAGRVIGIGDFRPRYGTYIATVEAL